MIICKTLSLPYSHHNEPELVGSSFPKPLNKGNFTIFAILNRGGGGVGMREVRGEGGEIRGGVGGCGIHRNICLIN